MADITSIDVSTTTTGIHYINSRHYVKNGAMEMVLDYQTEGNTNASFYAYDLSGRLLGSMINISKEKGSHHDVMVLCNRPVNNIVMLTMIADGIQQVFKIR